ncbi:MAG: DNA replication and repair protein RecF [Thermoleophilaceae bacterium]|nr:DNA replication and repair protein RecF [Thermoleophilaceae bacterium]
MDAVRVTGVALRNFRCYARAEARLAPGLTVVVGANGAGKSNLLEALYFGCTGRSSRTSSERELVRFGERVARVSVDVEAPDGGHRLEVGFEPGEAKVMRVDGAKVDSLARVDVRPLVSVFMPDRLDLVKGPPALRRAHLDRFVAALWPARGDTRQRYSRALAQRNALVARVRAGAASPSLLDTWDVELARAGIALMAVRGEALTSLSEPFSQLAAQLGLSGEARLGYRPRSRAATADELRAELRERREEDLARGFTTHGPHRDDLELAREGRPLRAYGSQGQQRAALLALLFAERELLAARGRPPLMLLDDVMSELDFPRRERLIELLRSGGQAVVAATEPEHVPGCGDPDVALLTVAEGAIAAREQVSA